MCGIGVQMDIGIADCVTTRQRSAALLAGCVASSRARAPRETAGADAVRAAMQRARRGNAALRPAAAAPPLRPAARLYAGACPIEPAATPAWPNRLAAQARASAAPAKLKPDWAGSEDLLSRVVNAAISTPGLYDVMKLLARQTLISTVRGVSLGS